MINIKIMIRYKHRLIEARLTELFQYYPVVAVLGARQAGKSTLVETLFSGNISVTVFDPVVDIGNARQDPDFFLQKLLSRRKHTRRPGDLRYSRSPIYQ